MRLTACFRSWPKRPEPRTFSIGARREIKEGRRSFHRKQPDEVAIGLFRNQGTVRLCSIQSATWLEF
jgi:hypothetical protein